MIQVSILKTKVGIYVAEVSKLQKTRIFWFYSKDNIITKINLGLKKIQMIMNKDLENFDIWYGIYFCR